MQVLLILSTVLALVFFIWIAYSMFRIYRIGGYVLHRVGSPGALITAHGPGIGTKIEPLSLKTKNNLFLSFPHPEKTTLYLLITRRCDVCKQVLRGLPSFYKHESQFQLVVSIQVFGPEDLDFVRQVTEMKIPVISTTSWEPFGRLPIPYAIAIDSNGVVIAKGIVNDISDIESICTAVEITQSNLKVVSN